MTEKSIICSIFRHYKSLLFHTVIRIHLISYFSFIHLIYFYGANVNINVISLCKRKFQTLAAATGNVCSPTVTTRVGWTIGSWKKNVWASATRCSEADVQLIGCHLYMSCCDTSCEVRKIVMSSPITPCSLNPRIPSHRGISRKFIDVLLPFVTQTVNASVQHGRLPDSQ